MNALKLCLHKGARQVSRPELVEAPTPNRTETWCPVGHEFLVSTIERQLNETGLRVTDQVHALSEDNQRYFGMLQVELAGFEVGGLTPGNGEYSWVLGLRNSHDKTFPAALAAGNRVFVCDNLSFNGEVQCKRRHTSNIAIDLPQVTSRVVAKLTDHWKGLDARIAAYKNIEINEAQVHDMVIKLMDVRAINTTSIPGVLKEWRAPSHPEFAQNRNAWRLFNAATEVLKGTNVFNLAIRTEAMHGVFDGFCGVASQN